MYDLETLLDQIVEVEMKSDDLMTLAQGSHECGDSMSS